VDNGASIRVTTVAAPDGVIAGELLPVGDGAEGVAAAAAELAELFDLLDDDGDDLLTLAEILAQLPDFGQDTFDAIDANGDGEIDEDEIELATGFDPLIFLGGCDVRLSGDQVEPTTISTALGEGFVDLFTNLFTGETVMKVFIDHDVDGVTGAELRGGPDDALLFDLGDSLLPVDFETVLEAEGIDRLLAAIDDGGLFVQLLSEDFPAGEIRGEADCFFFDEFVLDVCELELTGEDENPANNSDAFGEGHIEIVKNELTGRLFGELLIFHDVENPTAAHIHMGGPNENGPSVLTLPVGDAEGVIHMRIPEEDLGFYLNPETGPFYVNIHSERFPDGEIRGPIRCQVDVPPEPAPVDIADELLGSFNQLDTDNSGGLTLEEIQARFPDVRQEDFDALNVEEDTELTEDELLRALGFDPDILLTRCDVQLLGAEEVPGNESEASGSGFVELFENTITNQKRGVIYIEHDVVDATEAHIHVGAPGENGDILIGLGGASSPIEVELGDALVRLLLDNAGGLYVNIHSETYPDGEIRGQIECDLFDEAIIEACDVLLDGAQESTPNDATATGSALIEVLLSDLDGALGGRLLVEHDVADPTAAHIHVGMPGEDGPVLIDLGDPTSPIELELTAEQVEMLFENEEAGLYINIHSTEFPDGEIRGALLCAGRPGEELEEIAGDILEDFGFFDENGDGVLDAAELEFTDVTPEVFADLDLDGDGLITAAELLTVIGVDDTVFLGGCDTPLDGGQEVPPNGSRRDGFGFVDIFIDPFTGDVSGKVFIDHAIRNATGAHIHVGGPGENGDVLIDLGEARSPIEVPLSGEEVDMLLDHQDPGLYFNIHSEDFPGGEIRGNLFCFFFNEFVVDSCEVQLDAEQVSPPTDSVAFGHGYLDVLFNELTGETSGQLYIEHDVEAPTSAQIRIGEARVNGPLLMDLGPGNSPIEVRLSADELELLLDAELGGVYVDIRSDAYPDGEIRGAFQCAPPEEHGEGGDLEEIAGELLDNFQSLDVDGNGALSEAELADTRITDAQFDALDEEADGELTERELLRALGIETDIFLGGCDVFLSGDQELPPSGSPLEGWGFIDLISDAFTGEQRAKIYLEHNVDGATGAHIHMGMPGTNGDVVVDLGEATSPIEVVLVGDQLDAFLNAKDGGVYVNIHSPEFPDGEIRGQLDCFLFDEDILLTECNIQLNGMNQAPQNNSEALGAGFLEVRYSPLTGTRNGRIFIEHDVAGPTVAFIYNGGPGANGPVLFDLGDPASPIDVNLDEGQLDLLFGELEGGVYVNIHSASFPDGDIRGQLACVDVERPVGDFAALAADLLDLFPDLD
ncbi:MAG: CHRD domain-containing protein, partial [Candidatus Hydrogenedentes bacterium]|nr:CHRD domain-containing protein [Candidatus Hydrogenedentota bacterium]